MTEHVIRLKRPRAALPVLQPAVQPTEPLPGPTGPDGPKGKDGKDGVVQVVHVGSMGSPGATGPAPPVEVQSSLVLTANSQLLFRVPIVLDAGASVVAAAKAYLVGV